MRATSKRLGRDAPSWPFASRLEIQARLLGEMMERLGVDPGEAARAGGGMALATASRRCLILLERRDLPTLPGRHGRAGSARVPPERILSRPGSRFFCRRLTAGTRDTPCVPRSRRATPSSGCRATRVIRPRRSSTRSWARPTTAPGSPSSGRARRFALIFMCRSAGQCAGIAAATATGARWDGRSRDISMP